MVHNMKGNVALNIQYEAIASDHDCISVQLNNTDVNVVINLGVKQVFH